MFSTYGIAGFSHIEGSWIWHILYVRGKRCYRVPVIWPIYYPILMFYKRIVRKNLEMYNNR